MVSLRGNCHYSALPMNYAQTSAPSNPPPNGASVAPHAGPRGLAFPGVRQLVPSGSMDVSSRTLPTQSSTAKSQHESNSLLASNLNCIANSYHCRVLSQGQPYRYPRAPTPQRAECYHPAPATGGYMGSGMPAPGPNMAQSGMRGVPPTSQSPAATQPHPTQDLNKQAMTHNSAQQQQNRPQLFSSPYRTATTAARPLSHLRQQTHTAPLYQGSSGGGSAQMIYPMLYQPHGVIPQQYHSTPQRPGYQNVIIHQNPYCLNPYPQNQPPQQYYYQTASPLLAPSNMPSPAPTGRNTTNLVASQGLPPPAVGTSASSMQHPLTPPTHMHQNMTATRSPSVTQVQPLRKKRSFAITIKDPKTGEDVCADLFSEPSQPLSGESSERHTPQPEMTVNSVAEEFSRMVNETLIQHTTQETSSKPIFLSKSADVPLAASSVLNVMHSHTSVTNSNNNNMKSDLLPLTENKSLGADIECNDTPVVSAISDSPVIVPKLCPTVIKVQKGDSTAALLLDTNKNISAKPQKPSKIKPVVPIPDEEKLLSEVSAPVMPSAPMPPPSSASAYASMAMHMSQHPQMSVPAHMAPQSTHITMPTNVAAPPFFPAASHSYVTAAAPSFAPTAPSFVPTVAPQFANVPAAYVAAPAPAYLTSNASAPTFIPAAVADLAPAHVPMSTPISTPAQMSAPEQVSPAVQGPPADPALVPALRPMTAPLATQMLPPQPQRHRKSSIESRSVRRDSSPHADERVESAVAGTPNGPQPPLMKKYSMDRTMESMTIRRFPVSTDTETISNLIESEVSADKAEAVKIESRNLELKESRAASVLPTATELLAASIESVATRAFFALEEDLSFIGASQAQAKLHQSLASVSKNRGKSREKETFDYEAPNIFMKSHQAAKLTNDITKMDQNEKGDTQSLEMLSSKAMRDCEVDGSMNAKEHSKIETESKIFKEPAKLAAPESDELDAKTEEVRPANLPAKPTLPEKPTLKYNYKENQWSPLNTHGRKCYDKDFLLQLQDDPQSKKRPDNVHMLAVVMKSKSPEGFINTLNISRPNSESFLPPFAKSVGPKGPSREREREPKKSSMLASKPSMKGSISGSSNSNSGPNKNIIHVSLSLRSDVKLNESENAWKPTSRIKNSQLGGEDHQTEELYKKFRGILNKLTPQKFDKLLDQVKHLEINSQARLEGVIDLIFEKAIDEPSFSVAYAAMCNKLSKLKVLADNSSDQYVNFRGLIISKCQAQFETTKVQEGILNLEKELADCNDMTRRKEIHAMLEEENRKVRMRSVGNVRFIGELYKLKMLTSKIMLYCLNHLIDKLDEEKLECLCKLLTTIGEQVESEVKPQLDSIFKNMQDIVDYKSNRISSRVRFMLQDVIELRRKRWSSKNVIDAQPKTMDQIQKEADQQMRQIEIMNSAPMGREFRREEGGRSKRGSDSRRAGSNNFQDSWPSNKRPQPYQVDTSKLKAATNTNKNLSNIVLGPPHQWNHGAGAKTASKSAMSAATLPTSTNNMYSVLENANTDPSSLRGSKENTPSGYHSKGASIERITFSAKSEFSGSKTGSSGATRSSSSSRSGSIAPATPETAAMEPVSPPSEMVSPLTDQEVKVVRATIDLCLINPSDEEFVHEIKSKFKPAQHSSVVFEILNYALEKPLKTHPQIASSLLYLVSTNTISRPRLAAGLSELLDFAPDLYIDIPKFYDYLAYFVGLFILHKQIDLLTIATSSEKIITENQGHLLLRAIINEMRSMMGPSYVRLKWEDSDLKLNDWMNEEQALKFREEKNVAFLFGEAKQSEEVIIKKFTPHEMQEKLLHLMIIDQSCECIKGWIRDHIGKASSEEWFMRMLIQAVCEYALFGSTAKQVSRFNQDRMSKYIHLINEYGDSKEVRDANCLLGVQQLVHRLEHPKGVTLEIFQYLSDHYIIQREGFLAFEKSELEPEGKGVMMKALVSFFTNINEVDNEDSCSED